ncbi:MAG: peptidoglycan recognition family protein [Pirellulaceae bacterium]|nr:N-acetylmuramoyl-L-alanine amidase [Planctomycetales bacterium]
MILVVSSVMRAPHIAVAQSDKPRVGEMVPRVGDEIMVCGRLIHTTAPVVLWTDPGGYDAYRVERRFASFDKSSWEDSQAEVSFLKTPNRYGLRKDGLSPEQIETVRGGGWELSMLQEIVDQFVLHYDVCGTSQRCFQVLHDGRCLSVHFMLDIDGTIYQTLDLKERAWHATTSNTRSIGIEIANIGAYPDDSKQTLDRWYTRDDQGKVRLLIPPGLARDSVRTKDFIGHPARDELICGNVQGQDLCQYDFTNEQYESLIKLTATLCKVFPKLQLDYPHDTDGKLIPRKLDEQSLREFRGVLGHYHIQTNKTDPGPALQWDRVIDGAAKLMDGS